MKISGQWMEHPGTQALCALLEGADRKALFVGGCVRNAIFRVPVSDIDLATDALPQEVIDLAKGAGMKVVPTGLDHGTVTVIVEGRPHEVTTFRRDMETDGRHAVVAYTRNVMEDASRRDFTMNALYADRSGSVYDPIGGLPDLIARRVRFVGDPSQRIKEDFLRILRFFRFHAQYGDPDAGLDPDGLRACTDLAEGLNTLSRERVGSEIKKLLAARDPAPALTAMANCGVLRLVLPDADATVVPRLVQIEATEPPDWMRRLACLGAGPAVDLRLSRAEIRRISAIRRAAESDLTAAAVGWQLGREAARSAMMVRAAVSGTVLHDGWTADIQRGAIARFPVRSVDLMPLTGPALGQHLRSLEDQWLRSDLRLTRNELLL